MTAARLALLVLTTVPLIGCGGQTQTRVVAPFAKTDGTEAGGWAVLRLAPTGTTLRFVPNTSFGIGIVLRNTSHQTVTLVDVRTLDPVRSLVRQHGTRLIDWNPPPCTGRHSCPAIGFLRGPFGAAKPEPVSVRPTRQAAVQLDFEVGGCAAVPFAAPGAAQQIDVAYRVGSGNLQHQAISLGSSRLRLRMPSPRDCAPRPKSAISVSGPYATGSDWTIPVSSGDSCSRTATGALLYASRLYESPNGPSVRVEIRLPQFHGAGLYRSIGKPARALGPAAVDAIVGIGIHGYVTFRSSKSAVTVATVTTRTITGRFRATIVGRRHSTFRAYGAWRCLIQ